MGAFLVYYGVPLLALAVGARPFRRGLPYLAAFLVVARATLYTFSRGAYLALAGGSATVLLFGNPLLLAAAGGGGAVAVVLLPSLVPTSVVERLDETTTGNVGLRGRRGRGQPGPQQRPPPGDLARGGTDDRGSTPAGRRAWAGSSG